MWVRKLIVTLVAFSFLGFGQIVQAEEEFEPYKDEYYTPEFRAVARKIKSLDSCSSLYDCPTGPLVRTAKPDIVKMISEGKTTEEILDYFVDTYGEEILIEPKKKGFNIAAYAVPAAIIVGATGLIVYAIRFWTRTSRTEEEENVVEDSQDETESEIMKKMIDEERKKFL
ncbi:MAG: hypothetical protein K0S51_1369 [Bacillales bacterium]|jgi:cytochrome c-type biogenesis protein CcmH/NrfF|nr:hypothetical protein [Bacillales bacterium]